LTILSSVTSVINNWNGSLLSNPVCQTSLANPLNTPVQTPCLKALDVSIKITCQSWYSERLHLACLTYSLHGAQSFL